MSFFSRIFKSDKAGEENTFLPNGSYLNPYSTLGELDFHLISEGRHERLWDVLGAHIKRDADGTLIGTAFSVWAPNAQAVSLVGDHNFWDRNTHPMVRAGSTGIWEIFIPDVGPDTCYKFAICTVSGHWVDHADPMARATEHPPRTASVVTESTYTWQDTHWMETRKSYQPWRSAVSVYEVHAGSWRPGLSYIQMAEELVQYVKEENFTHVEFLPITE
ncbi:MAG: 1,4-alpha-glucan branching enzyme, partial [Actinobacteria bacterium]|nr:1,4-alpha-glucan branching enzyme [Actinomycetota bacterium]